MNATLEQIASQAKSHRTRIKICGITRLDDARDAVKAGASAIGFVFAESPRRISVEEAYEIGTHLHPSVIKVGVFASQSPEEILNCVQTADLDAAQLYDGDLDYSWFKERRPGLFVIQVLSVTDPASIASFTPDPNASMTMFDSKVVSDPMHPAETIPAAWLQKMAPGSFLIAGGLNATNVGETVRRLRPWGVDVSSGVELSPGVKDAEKVREFIAAVRAADSG